MKTKHTAPTKLMITIGLVLVALAMIAMLLNPPGSGVVTVSQRYVVQGETEPLYHLVLDERSSLAAIRAEAAKNPSIVNTYRTWTGESLLCLAAQKPRVDVAALLIQLGADVNGKDPGAAPTTYTPIYCAAASNAINRPEMIRFLLGAGADPNEGGGSGVSAAAIAALTHIPESTRAALSVPRDETLPSTSPSK